MRRPFVGYSRDVTGLGAISIEKSGKCPRTSALLFWDSGWPACVNAPVGARERKSTSRRMVGVVDRRWGYMQLKLSSFRVEIFSKRISEGRFFSFHFLRSFYYFFFFFTIICMYLHPSLIFFYPKSYIFTGDYDNNEDKR